MLPLIENIFCLISLIVLTLTWLFSASIISFYIKKIFKIVITRLNSIFYSVLIGTALEITLAFISLITMPKSQHSSYNTNNVILLGIKKGGYAAILLSPLTSIIASSIGIRIRRAPWK